MTYAPIALFVYNRPHHTTQTLWSIQNNALSCHSHLVVISDGPKTASDAPQIAIVRAIARAAKGFRSVRVIEHETNYGLAQTFIKGISAVTAEFGKAIILEDDNVVAPFFLDFINDGLRAYEDEGKVAAIAGYLYPLRQRFDRPFFIRGSDVWGFGVWERSWRHFEPDASKLLALLTARNVGHDFDYSGSVRYTGMLQGYLRGLNDSWSSRWHASAFLKNMMTLYPNESLVNNIGLDSSGTHCGSTNAYDTALCQHKISVQKEPVVESMKARQAIVAFHRRCSKTPRSASRVVSAVRKIVRLIVRRASFQWRIW